MRLIVLETAKTPLKCGTAGWLRTTDLRFHRLDFHTCEALRPLLKTLKSHIQWAFLMSYTFRPLQPITSVRCAYSEPKRYDPSHPQAV